MTCRISAVALLALAVLNINIATGADASPMQWSQLPPIPDREGFAAPFAGVSGGALIVAGGANIQGEKWGETFQKVWHDSVFILEKPDGVWRSGLKLPRALGYGVSITLGDSVICIGGSDAIRHYADVFRMTFKNGALEFNTLPALPRPCANACGALIGDTIFVAGGLESPTSTTALKTFWKLDLTEKIPAWIELPHCPGPARMLAVAGVRNGAFYLFSGASLSAGPDGKPVREYLRDAYRFHPGENRWERLADLPRATVAAPTPAAAVGDALVIFSGDDGVNIQFKPLIKHPGFPKEALAFDAEKNAWSTFGAVPFSRATVPMVVWNDKSIVPNGEERPRERTAEVWSMDLKSTK